MRMIPDTPHGTHSNAEKRVFDKLRAISFNEEHGEYTAYHSLNLTQHAYKRFGEIDFLICCPQGIFAIEVKGGGVACHQGEWKYTDHFGEVHKSAEGPFKQVESALHGLLKKLRENLPHRVVDQFSIGYGVIFPDCEWNVPGAEWDKRIIADARSCNDMGNWLQGLFRYWRNKDGGRRQADRDALRSLNRYLRPEFEVVVPLYVRVSGVEERVAQLTDDQMVMVDVVHANQRVLCSGGAGTGKTFLALELARRWTASGKKVLLTCYSPWLKNYLETRFSMPNLTVSLVGAARTACQRADSDYFDALIVDEGQDMFNMESLDKLDSVLSGGLAEGRWCFFHDMNNQSRLLGKCEDEAISYLHLLKSAEVPLRTNCRNTRVILKKVQTSLGADMGIKGAGEGPAIREHSGSRDECMHLLENEIVELIDHGGLAPGDVTILSPLRYNESCVSCLPKRAREKITVLDEYAVRFFPGKQTGFARIADYKGLENEAIIVTDLTCPDRDKQDLSLHYVAMSRPRAVLSLIYQTKTQ